MYRVKLRIKTLDREEKIFPTRFNIQSPGCCTLGRQGLPKGEVNLNLQRRRTSGRDEWRVGWSDGGGERVARRLRVPKRDREIDHSSQDGTVDT